MKDVALSGTTWTEPRCPEERQEVDAYRPASLVSWLLPWGQQLVENPLPKVGLAAMVMAITRATDTLAVPFVYCMAAWSVDFAVGALRAIADPKVKLSTERAWHGIIKGLAIPCLLLLAAIIEGMTFEAVGWYPEGKLVLLVAVGIVWEEATSAQRNGKHFFKSLRFRMSALPWMKSNGK